jgi:hypothetical protein
MRIPFFVCILLASPVRAADFRVLNFGDSCEPIRGLEKALGTREASWPGLSPDVPAFTGRAFDHEVTISYFCLHGKFAAGNYFFEWQPLDDAVRTLHDTYNSLVKMYGAPYADATPWHVANAQSGEGASDPSIYSAFWRGDRINTTLLLKRGDASGTRWQVAIVSHRRAD